MLIVLAGLPGVGKTSIARVLARELRALHLRIDTIEQALLRADVLKTNVGAAGYLVGYAVAEENLRAGLTVIADSVNPLPVTRDMWCDVATRAGAAVHEIEVVCSDPREHRLRVETRVADIVGHRQPTWQDVLERDYAPWTRERVVIDTSRTSVAEAVESLLEALGARAPS